MNFVPVNELPKKKTGKVCTVDHKPVYQYLKEFMKMDIKYAKVAITPMDYSNPDSAESCLRMTINSAGLPIKVARRGDDVYLVRTDKEE